MPGKREAKNRHTGAATPPRVAGPRASALSPNVLGVLCAFAAIALYLPALPYGWVWDDRLLVISNGAGGVGAEGLRLLTSLLFRLEWASGYGSPLFAHMVSILLHGAATWLFFRMALHVGARPGIAFVAALLFAAHPVHVEAVAYISGLPDLLATVFVLTALLLARSAELCTPEGCRSWKIWPAYAAMVAAVLSDEVAIVTPFLLVGLDRWGPVRVPLRQRLTHYSGFFAIALVYLLVRFVSGGGATPTLGSADAASGIDAAARAWAVPMAVFEYLKMLVYPHPLNALRALHAGEVSSWTGRLAPFAALAGLALIVVWRRRDPIARAGALLLLLPLLPALPLPMFIGSFAAERGAYLASVGLCLIVASIYAWAARSFAALRPLLLVAAIVIAAVAGLDTLLRLPVWRDDVSLLYAAVASNPKDPGPHLTLVNYFGHAREWPAALAEIDRAIALDPKNHAAVAKRTAILSQLGRFSDAEGSARRVLAGPACDLVAEVEVLGRRGLLRHAQVAPGQRSRRFDVLDSLEAEQKPPGVRAYGGYGQRPKLGVPHPEDAGAGDELTGEARHELDGDFSRKAVRPADSADEKQAGSSSRERKTAGSAQSRTRILTFLPRAAAAAPTKARSARTVRPSRPIRRPRSPSGTAIS